MGIFITFIIKMFEYTLGAMIRMMFRGSSRKRKYYSKPKSNWKRKSLNQVKDEGIIRFSFGKYFGKPVEEIWHSDKGYIDWLRENVDLTRYPNEELMIEELLNAEA